MIQGVLKSDVLKDATSVTIEPIGALSNFNVLGGVAYIERDKITYTSITVNTTDFVLEGCTGVTFSHDEGTDINSFFGARFVDVVPPALKNARYDPDGFANALFRIMDTGMFNLLKDAVLEVYKNIDPLRADVTFLKYLCSNLGLEYNENMPEDVQRSLARHAADLLSMRCTENAYRFLIWHVLGYYLDIQINRSKVIARMNDRNFHMYMPPTEFVTDDKTVGYWKFTEGAGVTVANEISGGPSFTLLGAGAWNTDSMFVKDTSAEIDAVLPYFSATGAPATLGFLHGKRQWSLEWFMKPAVGGVFPQVLLTKGSLVDVQMTSATDIQIILNDGITAVTHTFANALTTDEWNYVAILFDRPTLTLCVNGEIIDSSILFDLDTIDEGLEWVFGDLFGVAPYLGLIDTFRVSVGKKYPAECFQYFNHIRQLRTIGTSVDETSYMLDDFSDDGKVTVVVLNGDGDAPRTNFLEYLTTEWLTLSNYEIVDLAHLPLELELGLF